MEELKDLQNSKSDYDIPLKTVGIRNFKMPISLIKKNNDMQYTVANIDIFVDLKGINKGVNMSRLPIGIQIFKDKILNSKVIDEIAAYIRKTSEAERCQLIYQFPYFLTKKSPVSELDGLIYYNITFDLTNTEDKTDFYITISSMGTSLCPCSKEISENQGAHNQRSTINITTKIKENNFVWIEDIIKIIESCYSCEIYSVLKRPDEKHVTMAAYNNPKFVEDISRELISKLNKLEGITNYEFEVINHESIHQHDAYCHIKK